MQSPRFNLGMKDTLRIIWPYVKRNFLNQVQGIWFIVTYLIVFQWLIFTPLPAAFSTAMAGSAKVAPVPKRKATNKITVI